MINFRQDKDDLHREKLKIFAKKTVLIEEKLIFYKIKFSIYGNIDAF